MLLVDLRFGLVLSAQKDAQSPSHDLEDMQSLIYLTEEADAQLRSGNLGMALKKYDAIHKIFDAFEDDQFDFHGYSVRKFTVNIYMKSVMKSVSWLDVSF